MRQPKEEIASPITLIRLFNVPSMPPIPSPKEKATANGRNVHPSPRRFQRHFIIRPSPAPNLGRARRPDRIKLSGTRIEPWTTIDGFKSVSELSELAKKSKPTPDTKVGGGTPSAIYNSMVHPLTPFAMRGAIWYQGESNGAKASPTTKRNMPW